MKRKYLQVDHEANFYAEYAIAIPPTSQKKQWEKKRIETKITKWICTWDSMSLNPFRDPDGLMSGSARYALLDSASCDKSLN